jgi:[protein-PII] uridylyltransferase
MNALEPIDRRRSIIDRRALAERIAALGAGAARVADISSILAEALAAGRAEVAARLTAEPARGRAAARATAFLHDQIVRLAYDAVAPGDQRIALVGLGGTGRGEMAPYSDLDLMFLTAAKPSRDEAQAAEAVLHLLWDLKLKIGHSLRSTSELLALAKTDMTIRTALLEARLLWGEEALFDVAMRRFRKEVTAGTAAEFVAAKLAERDARHVRMGDSRYVVEPNVKDGKGGLRDLHTLYWIGKYVHAVERPSDLVGAGLLTKAEFHSFERAERFFWAVRCHLHLAAGRAEERLGFDHQQHIALPTIRRRPKHLNGFMLDRGRLSIPSDGFLAEKPVRLLELFALAARERLEIHPNAMRAATRDAKLIDAGVRADPLANALFMEVLTNLERPELVLRWMNDAGVFGRFVPDFGRVVAQMQFDMYHHYTVDEHSIRAIGLLAAIERGELADDHPLSTALFRQIASRRTLYVAVLLHDIAKGRGGDHSVIGSEIAMKLGPRFGLDAAETETVAWLVRNHLLMSATAFKRDLADPKTIEDFVSRVQSPERLRLLLILTVVDIRAVGPGVWTEWKRVLLRTLFDSAEERLRLGHKQRGRSELIAARQSELARALNWKPSVARAYAKRLRDAYWLAESLEWQIANARQVALAEARIGEAVPSVVAEYHGDSNATRISVFSPDREGLFYRICAGLAAAGANIIDARVHTTRDGMALDNLLVLDSQGRAYSDRRLRGRLVRSVEAAVSGDALPRLPAAERRPRAAAFRVAPSVVIAEHASSRTTVVEVNALDRIALLAALARAIHLCGHQIHSAHIATYGERAVDVFYLTNGGGKKLSASEADELRLALLEAAGATDEAQAA